MILTGDPLKFSTTKKISRKIYENLSSWSNLCLGNSRNFFLRGESELLVKKKYPLISARKSIHLILIFSCYFNKNHVQGNHCFLNVLVSYDKYFSEPYVDDILTSKVNLM